MVNFPGTDTYVTETHPGLNNMGLAVRFIPAIILRTDTGDCSVLRATPVLYESEI